MRTAAGIPIVPGTLDFFDAGGTVLADWVTFDVPLKDDTYSTAQTLTAKIGVISDVAGIGARSIEVLPQVVGDLMAGRSRSQFELRTIDETGSVTFAGWRVALPTRP